jgi:glutathione S-transferase
LAAREVTTMSITFYYAPRSTATRVHWALEELQVPYAKVKLDLSAGDHRKADFLRLNPNGKVPLLVDESTPIFESLAILIHLGQKYGTDSGLWPRAGAPAQGQALSWTVWGISTLGGAVRRLAFAAGDPRDARAEVDPLLQILDARLAPGLNILGERFTLVDVATAGALHLLGRTDVSLDGYPQVKEWLARVTSRPALATVTRE